MCSWVAAVKALRWAPTSSIVVVKLAEPTVLAVGSELWTPQSSGPMMVEPEPWQVPVPMGSHWLRVPLEPAPAMAASTVAGFGLEFVMVATHSLVAAVAGDTEQTSRVGEAALAPGPGPGPTLVGGPGVVEPTEAAAGLLAEVVPKGVVLGLFAVVESTGVDEDEAEFAGALPRGPGAAAFALVGLELDPKLVALAGYSVVATVPMVAELVFALEGGPRLGGHGSGVVLAPQVDSMTAGFEGSM